MYNVSSGFLTALNTTPVKSKIEGTITLISGATIDVSNDDIINKSLVIKNQSISQSTFDVGSAYVGQMNLSLVTDNDNLFGAKVELSYYLYVNNAWESVPLGIYTVYDAVRSGKYLKLTCYDNMPMLDITCPYTTINGSIYDVLTYISEETGLQLGQTEEEIEAMPNGMQLIKLGEQETYRKAVCDIASMLCAFATINRLGKLIFVNYKTSPVTTITDATRKNTNVSLGTVHYDGAAVDVNGEIRSMPAIGLVSATNTLVLSENTIFNTENNIPYVTGWLRNIASKLNALEYTSCSYKLLGNPALDLGDMVEITTDGNHVCNMLIMSYVWKYHGDMTINSSGSSSGSSASATTQALYALSNTISANLSTLKMYSNSEAYTLGADYTEVIEIEFDSKSATQGFFQGQVLLSADATSDISFRYVFNDATELVFVPMQSITSGYHIIPLFYTLTDIPEATTNTFKVEAKVTSGSVSILTGKVKGIILGQGLVMGAGNWSGKVEVSDRISTISLNNIDIVSVTESVSAETDTPTSGTLSDTMSAITLTGITIGGVTESITTTLTDAE